MTPYKNKNKNKKMHHSLSNFFPLNKMLDLNSKVILPNKKELEFFRQNNLSNRNFKDFMQHCQLTNRTFLKIDKVISQYKLCLNNIK